MKAKSKRPPSLSSLRSPLKTHGGKHRLAPKILPLLPPHRVYVQPYCGGLNPLLKKPPAELEIATDVDPDTANFWDQVQNNPGLFLALGWPYTPETFAAAAGWCESDDPAMRAAGFLIRRRFSRGGIGDEFGWADRQRGNQPGDANAWFTLRKLWPRIVGRVAKVRFYCEPALRTIADHDDRDVLFYLDPPYLPETRKSKKVYRFEMTREDHVELLKCVTACKGSVALSGYPSRLYDDALVGWERHEFPVANDSGQTRTKETRIECLWIKRSAS